MSIASEITRINTNISNAYTKCNGKGATMPVTQNSNNLPDCIDSIPTGSSGPIIEGTGEFEVRFIDPITGDVLKYHYVDSGGSATPPTPLTHDRLTFDHWSLPYTNVTRDVDVGAIYRPTSGKSEVHFTLTEETGLTIELNLTTKTAGILIVTYYDGTSQTQSGIGVKTFTKTYPSYGDYVLYIEDTGKYALGGNTGLFGASTSTTNKMYQCKAIKKVYLNSSCAGTPGYGLYNCQNLEEFTQCGDFTYGIGGYTFAGNNKLKAIVFDGCVNTPVSVSNRFIQGSSSVKAIVLPQINKNSGNPIIAGVTLDKLVFPAYSGGVSSYGFLCYNSSIRKVVTPYLMSGNHFTMISGNCYYNNPTIEEIKFEEGITSLSSSYTIYNCYSLLKVTFSSTVTSISNNFIMGNPELYDMYFYATTPPTLGGTGCFSSLPTICKIHVPAGSEDAYKTATNWTNHASKIVGDL